MRLAIGNILLCAGVLALAVQWENWRKPDVVRRIISAARKNATPYSDSQKEQVAAQSRRMDGISQGKQGR